VTIAQYAIRTDIVAVSAALGLGRRYVIEPHNDISAIGRRLV